MRILFTPVGDTDPVRGYHDGGMLHILRHYAPVDRIFVFLTKEMEDKEAESECYTKGIQKVAPQCKIEFIRSGITEPHIYESLTLLQDVFQEKYEQYPNKEWLLNLSSGTPQIKTVIGLIGLDYPETKAIQVLTPGKSSNSKNHPEETPGLVEMLDCNDDNDPAAPNRCKEAKLSLLKKHSVKWQIISLVENYEYEGALQLLRQNRHLFSDISEKLLRHAVCRRNLMWRDANKIISSYKGSPLISKAGDFEEFFRVMELRQRKKQLSEFIIKISPILKELGEIYLKNISGFDINSCGQKRRDVFRINRNRMEKNHPQMLSFIEKEIGNKLKDGPLYYNIMVYMCEYFREYEYKNDKKHNQLTDIFLRLRNVEKKVRNPVAHEITNMDEEKIQRLTAENVGKGLKSKDILRLLHEAVKIVRGQDILWDYDELNNFIIDSL